MLFIGTVLLLFSVLSFVSADVSDYTPAEQEYVAGNGYFLMGDLIQAERAYVNATRLSPSLSEAWNNLGIVRKKLGNYQGSIDAYRQALSLTPKDEATWYNYGLVLDALSRYNESVQAYQKTVSLNPNMTPAWFNLTESLLRCGDTTGAAHAYEQAQALDPLYAANWSFPDGAGSFPDRVDMPGTSLLEETEAAKTPLSPYIVLVAGLCAGMAVLKRK